MLSFYYCKKAEIFDAANERMVPAAVSTGAMDSLLITVSRDYVHKSGDPVEILFYDPIQGLATCRCMLTSPLNVDRQNRSFRCQVLEILSRDQRRQDIKISLTSKVTVTLEGAARQAALAGLGREEVLGILEGAWAKQEGSDGK